MEKRRFNLTDRLLIDAGRALRTVAGHATGGVGPHPDDNLPDSQLAPEQRRLAGRLMRVNHAGEVSAQALYNGQALVSRDPDTREHLYEAAEEEYRHLVWCERRLAELGVPPSRLGPFWYLASYAIGAVAGACGDRWSLGFVAETEEQVIRHLRDHIDRLPADDQKTRAILAQMQTEEGEHARNARLAGAEDLPLPVRVLMHAVSRLMTTGAYYL